MYTINSTAFGSIIIKRTSSGVERNSMLIMIEFTHTDLPEPVVPAISIWGIFAISHITISPEILFPIAEPSLLFVSLNDLLSTSSRKGTLSTFLFGTSIPTAAFPGIGASIRTPGVASLSAISSTSPVIFDIFTPGAGCSS